MAPNFPFNSSQSGFQPDATPAGLDGMSMKQAQVKTFQTQVTRAHQPVQYDSPQKRPKPEVRPKNQQLDEIYRLKQELSNLRDEHAHVQSSMGKMAQDLMATEMEMELKDRRLKQEEAEILALRQKNEALSTALLQERMHRASAEDRLSTPDNSSTIQMTEMRDKIETLSTALREQSNVQQGNEDAARLGQEKLQLMQSLQMKDLEVVQMQEELGRLNRVLAEKEDGSKDQDLVAAQAVRLTELRGMCNFYQSNSERLSGDIKIVWGKNTELQQSIQAKTREIHELSSLLRSQGYS
jgi:hypothetical protein